MRWLVVAALFMLQLGAADLARCLQDAIKLNTIQKEVARSALLELQRGDWTRYAFTSRDGRDSMQMTFVGLRTAQNKKYFGVEYLSHGSIFQIWYSMRTITKTFGTRHTFSFVELEPAYGYFVANGMVITVPQEQVRSMFGEHWLQFTSWGAERKKLDCSHYKIRFEPKVRELNGQRFHTTKIVDLVNKTFIEVTPSIPFGIYASGDLQGKNRMEAVAFGHHGKIHITQVMRKSAQSSMAFPMMPMQ